MLLLIVPFFMDLTVLIVGLSGLGVFSYLAYFLFLKPTLQVLAERRGMPPEDGFTTEILFEHNRRVDKISIGQLDSTINTRIMGIKEDHLVLLFRKEVDLEEYEISVIPGGPVFYRAPHGARIEQMKSPEKFESSELIGHPALFRLAAFVQHNRLLQYVEMELSCSFFINRSGEEKMKFHLKLNRIYPGVDKSKPPKKGVYFFSRLRSDENEDQSENE